MLKNGLVVITRRRIGDFRLVDSDRLLALKRFTERLLNTVIILVTPSMVTERIFLRNTSLMSATSLVDLRSSVVAPPFGVIDAECAVVIVLLDRALMLTPRCSMARRIDVDSALRSSCRHERRRYTAANHSRRESVSRPPKICGG